MLRIEHLNWDSDFFGYKVGRISLDKTVPDQPSEDLILKAKQDAYKLLYLFVPAENYDINTPAAQLVDQKATYAKTITGRSTVDTSEVESYTAPDPNEAITDLALQSGEYSRFRVDPGFMNNEFRRLYEIWIMNSVNRSIAEEVFVIRDQDKEIGLITLSIKNNIGNIGLLSVDSSYRNRSLGKKLLAKVEDYCFEKGITTIHVVTQSDNKIACSFYEKNGYRLFTCEKIYHLWI